MGHFYFGILIYRKFSMGINRPTTICLKIFWNIQSCVRGNMLGPCLCRSKYRSSFGTRQQPSNACIKSRGSARTKLA